jgi:Tfp pilus assembly protein PilV
MDLILLEGIAENQEIVIGKSHGAISWQELMEPIRAMPKQLSCRLFAALFLTNKASFIVYRHSFHL